MGPSDGNITTHPLQQLTVNEAKEFQFRLVDLIHRQFDGREALEAGDYGAPPELGRSRATAKVEAVLAEFFDAEDAALVTGAGTGAIRAALIAVLEPGARVVVHDFPIYATTAVTFRAMGLRRIAVDLNDRDRRADAMRESPDLVYLQHSRQRLDDAFDIADVIDEARRFAPGATVMVDDNYTVMQVPRSGVELGADLSAFSLFKLLGEPGVGCVIGRADLIRRIRDDAYSGGSKVQGPVALASLKGLVYAPVALAVQSEVVDEVIERLNAGEVSGVARAHPGNHQERSILVELDDPIARAVFDFAWRWGAAPYPVGSQSRVETNALIYRLSRAMCEADPDLAERMIRISPFRSGAATILRVLDVAIEAARQKVS
jgi:cystathionine beta-lyase/cystathionine gamma-synthase